jgi:hypothetical protein
MHLKPGTRLRSTVCATEVIVVLAPADVVDPRCGGRSMAPIGEDASRGSVDPAHSGGTQLDKRYADPTSGLELLCTKGGEGSLSLGDKAIALKDAKPLPSSD